MKDYISDVTDFIYSFIYVFYCLKQPYTDILTNPLHRKSTVAQSSFNQNNRFTNWKQSMKYIKEKSSLIQKKEQKIDRHFSVIPNSSATV